jgi:MFS family permease
MEEKKGLKEFAEENPTWLFWACFIALVATSFGFIIRTQIIGDWGIQFNLSETQKGELLGVGLWPFAITIILFSFIVDKIGYGRAMIFAFACHIISAVLTIFANGYWMLYIGTFIVALGNGTVEAVINPVVATVFHRDKTKWLNILHAGWPGGLVLGGLITLVMGPGVDWRWKVALIFIPAVAYGLMMLRTKFPVHERVKAGISYKAMLQEAGVLGAAIITIMIIRELGRVFQMSLTLQIIIAAVLVLGYGLYVRTLGRPLFVILLLIMIPLATTELGTDSWITDLVKPIMTDIGLQAGWVLVYTSFIMMVVRFAAGPIVHRLTPLGTLAVCSLIAIVGLVTLSKTAGIMVFFAATIYGFGKSLFWPTMLGIVAERFPKGGALTINTIAGFGMLTVGVIGAAFLGNIQDNQIDQELRTKNPVLHQRIVDAPKVSVFGEYQPLDHEKIEALPPEQQNKVKAIVNSAKKNALQTVALFPAIMLVCYLILILYFRSKGGYKPISLTESG